MDVYGLKHHRFLNSFYVFYFLRFIYLILCLCVAMCSMWVPDASDRERERDQMSSSLEVTSQTAVSDHVGIGNTI